ncbi:carbon storage regulator [Sporomusaceae bacterium BoRhaA]|uniref:carbon storage regulator n=1 Tax=Pelorhabdus rhamnosifermentans TaxID=2772457 RepID=UPI001C06300D|nr:carbon storage regulator [Pelorhabdus rhamnosifermentans]MBU2702566.1 carbon storage regulator [Pelorhabdus rhamnosifermentans]
MLVLGRKPGEYVMIGKDIMVKVVKNDGGNLKLAITAPKCLNIIRGEIYEDKLRYMPEEKMLPIQPANSNGVSLIANNWTLQETST